MNFSEVWNSKWPIAFVYDPPLLLSDGGGGDCSSNNKPKLGPLVFNPSPETRTLLFSSPSLSPRLPPPLPHLSISRFISTFPSPEDPASLLPSTSAAVANDFGAQIPGAASEFHHNRLQLLRCPGTSSVLAFCPTGENSDRIGFVVLSVKDSKIKTEGVGDGVYTSINKLNHRILRIVVNPVDCDFSGSGSPITIGYLMACTMYGVHWYSVKINGINLDSQMPRLDCLGSKVFKSSAVADVCWSPHLPEESLVLLQSGDLFLFDVDSCSSSCERFKGNKLKVSWKGVTSLKKGGWLSCAFGWHPRVLIIAHSAAVFLVDLRRAESDVSCLLKIEMLYNDVCVQDDRFVAFSQAGSDGFCFVVASSQCLLLCDTRKPLMPLLQWAHRIASPSYIDVFSLSNLRSHSKDENFSWASETGRCILLGSFWNCQFTLFCYGAPREGPVASVISRICKSVNAWELPSEISLSGRECPCGSCFVKEEFSKDALPDWIDWRQKKDIVTGFGILEKDLHVMLSGETDFGGFTLVRLMSSGKLESQRYHASWEFTEVLEEAHKESPLQFKESLLYALGDSGYKFTRRFKYIQLDYLTAYMKGDLAKLLLNRKKTHHKPTCENGSLSEDFHQSVCEKLKACGLSTSNSFPDVSNAIREIRPLTSVREVALEELWAGLPKDLLRMAFSCYPEFVKILLHHRKVSLEFLALPKQLQLPPFFYRTPSGRSSKWSQKIQPDSAAVGPLLPTPVLHTLHMLQMEEGADILSANAKLDSESNQVLQIVSKISECGSAADVPSDHAVSLADDQDEVSYNSQQMDFLCSHKKLASFSDDTQENSACLDENFTTFISRKRKKENVPNTRKEEVVGSEFFDSLLPIEVKFDENVIKMGPDQLKTFKLLKRQFSNFLESVSADNEH